MTNVEIAWEDVVSVIEQLQVYLYIIGFFLVLLIVALIISKKLKSPHKGFVRAQSVITFLVIFAIIVNIIILGPLRSTISTAFMQTGELSPETEENSLDIIQRTVEEGIVLVKNEDNTLPLDTQNLNVFGWASTNPVYGGSGSGAIDISVADGILEGLENAGFNLNSELSDMYIDYQEERGDITINNGQDWTLPEPPVSEYSEEMLDNAREFSDTALIVIGRVGGEGADLPHDMGAVLNGSWSDPGTKYLQGSYTNNSTEYSDFTDGQTFLELSQTEQKMIDMVTENFDNVIVAYNGANPFEMGWTDEYEEIKGVVLIGSAGVTGFNALGTILNGEVNPSGRTSDTWVHDLTETPYFNNIGHFELLGQESVVEAAQEHWPAADGIASFVNYVEGIYVGYRFYETAADEDLIDYDEVVQYPFGYGLSYTTFEQEMEEMVESDGTITVDITVTNTGDIEGKDVVQLYNTPPYYNGGIEKSSVNLIDFDKTDLLSPGESQTVTLSFEIEDLAAFDAYGTGFYVLEEGDYVISLRTDSHNVIEEQIFTIDEEVVYNDQNIRSTDNSVATNQLQFAEGDVTYLSRQDGFSNYDEATAYPTNFELDVELLANGTYDPTEFNDPNDEMPTLGADNGLEIEDLRGTEYNDPLWEDLLDQLTIEEMQEFIAYGGHGTIALNSINLVPSITTDGPAGVNFIPGGVMGTGFPGEIVLGQSWNTDLAYEMTDAIMQEMDEIGIRGWYAPSMNIHRSAFNGRNFEYYSEDPILSAGLATAQTQAVTDHGVIPFLKHFAFNEQETNRNAMLTTWLPEQAAREIYLRPFEKTVKNNDGSSLAMMSVFNYIGNEWGGSTPELLNNILRDEWGFQGLVLTDYFGDYGYMDADRAIRNGGDLMLGMNGGQAIVDDESATSVLAMRQAMKNNLYTLVNSALYEDGPDDAGTSWINTVVIVNISLGVLLVGVELFAIRGYRKKLKNSQ